MSLVCACISIVWLLLFRGALSHCMRQAVTANEVLFSLCLNMVSIQFAFPIIAHVTKTSHYGELHFDLGFLAGGAVYCNEASGNED